MTYLNHSIRDNGIGGGLSQLAAAGRVDLHLCQLEPATYEEATSTASLGAVAAIAVSEPEDTETGGRQVTVAAIEGLEITTDGTATHEALVDSLNGTLLVTTALTSDHEVIMGETFDLAAHRIAIPDVEA